MSRNFCPNITVLVLGTGLVIGGLSLALRGGYNFSHGASLFLLGCACLLVSFLGIIRTKKIRLISLISLFSLALFASIWTYAFVYRLNQPIVDAAAYEKVVNGLTKEEVVELLGEPAGKFDEIYKPYGSVERWRYAKGGAWQIVDIYFNAEGRVVEKIMDK